MGIMRKTGSVCDYVAERNRELALAYRQCIVKCRKIKMWDTLKEVVNMPSSRLWISEPRAAAVIREYLSGKRCGSKSRRSPLYAEVWRRYQKLAAERPDDSFDDIVYDVVNSPAPKFYLTAGSAKVILCKFRCAGRHRE